jgi:hypothetical protein
MLKRFEEFRSIGSKGLEHILFALDSMLKSIKLNRFNEKAGKCRALWLYYFTFAESGYANVSL